MKWIRFLFALALAAGASRFVWWSFRAGPPPITAGPVTERWAPRVQTPGEPVPPKFQEAAVSGEPMPAAVARLRAISSPTADGGQEESHPALAGLPLPELEHLQRIALDYRELSDEIYARSSGLMPSADRAELAFLQKEERTDLSALLTQDALDDLERAPRDTPWPRRR